MMEKNADKVSLLVDGELDACDMSCIIGAIKSDGEARTRWQGYHLIRDTLHRNLPRQLPVNLAERVSQALEHEPHFINPRSPVTEPAVYRASSRTKATVGFALAASLSAIAVFGVGVMEFNGGNTGAVPAAASVAVVQTPWQVAAVTAVMPSSAASGVQVAAAQETARTPSVALLASAGAPAQTPARRSGVSVDTASPAETDLYDYLVNAHRYTPGAADTQEMLSYVQLVGYGPGN